MKKHHASSVQWNTRIGTVLSVLFVIFSILCLTFTACKTEPEIVNYTVQFDPNGGSPVEVVSVTVEEGTKVAAPANNPVRTGYGFAGWYTNADSTEAVYKFDFSAPVTKNITLYAGWVELFTVTFDANGGEWSDPVSTTVTETVASGSTVSRPATNPAKPNHGFSDWYTEAAGTTAYNFDTPVTGNITLYAGYAVDKRMVNFTLTGGSTFPDDSGQASYARVDYGSTVPEPVTPSRYGFTFTGWYTDAAATDLYDFNTPVIEDLNLYTGWTTAVYDVTFESNGGGEVETRSVTHSTPVEKPSPDPERTGYKFDGWYMNEGLTTAYNFSANVFGPITLYAKWKQILTVTFDSNGGSEVPSVTVTEGDKITKPAADPTKIGSAFISWCIDQAGNTAYDFNSLVSANTSGTITLYAKWAGADDLVVTFITDGGTVITPASVPLGAKAVRPEDPVKPGYEFGGWYTTAECTSEYDFNSIVTANITLYAKFTLRVFTGVDDVAAYLAAVGTEYGTSQNPIPLSINIDMGSMSTGSGGWVDLVTAIGASARYVNLDLSASPLADGVFNPLYTNDAVVLGKQLITGIILPNAATEIAKGTSYASGQTFKNFTALKSVRGDNVIKLNDNAFSAGTPVAAGTPTLIEEIILPKLTEIAGSYTFYGAPKLTRITISAEMVTDMTTLSFHSCPSLTSFTLTGTGRLSVIDDGKGLVQDGTVFVTYSKTAASVKLPEGITTISQYAFSRNYALKSIELPVSLTTIQNYGISGQSSTARMELDQVIIHENLESIGNYGLQYVTITTLTCEAVTPPSAGTNAFRSSAIAGVKVPAASVDAYKSAAQWSNLAGQITAIE